MFALLRLKITKCGEYRPDSEITDAIRNSLAYAWMPGNLAAFPNSCIDPEALAGLPETRTPPEIFQPERLRKLAGQIDESHNEDWLAVHSPKPSTQGRNRFWRLCIARASR
jgi:hypothetical protein